MARFEYAELQNLLGAYFHQDWNVEAKDWQGVVDLIRRDNDAEICRQAADQIDFLVAQQMDEDAMLTLLNSELRIDYVPCPSVDGQGVRDWLRQVALRLRADAPTY